MNYLAHAFFSGTNEDILLGNMMGDFVKGSSILDTFPDTIRKGIELHRSIDAFTDQHTATIKAKNYFRPVYGLYSGAFVDVVYDHFLANDAKYFPQENDVAKFSLKTFHTLDHHLDQLPKDFLQIYKYMKNENWLLQVKSMKGLETSINRLTRRMPDIENGAEAYRIFVQHYYELNQIYFEFIDDVENFVKSKLM